MGEWSYEGRDEGTRDEGTRDEGSLDLGPIDGDMMPRGTAEDLGVGIQSAATAQARCDARLLELLGEFDAGVGWAWFEGISSCAHWVAWACSMSPGTAREHVRVARALRSMPEVAARFADGALTFSKVRELTRLAGRVDENELCELAEAQTASQLARTVRSYRAHSGTHLEQVDRRRLSWRDTEDGMVRLSVTLLPEEAAVLRGAVEAAGDRQIDASGPSDQPTPDIDFHNPDSSSNGSPGASSDVSGLADGLHQASGPDDRADECPSRPMIDPVSAICDVARCYLDIVPGTPVDDADLVVVHVGLETLAAASARPSAHDHTAPDHTADNHTAEPIQATDLCPSDVPAGTSGSPFGEQAPSGRPVQRRAEQAWIERGGPIEAATAARHACDAGVVGMIVDQNGDVLAMGRTRRFATAAQRRALRVRDGAGCQFPGCHQHRRLKAHHVIFWVDGGPTDLDNLVLLCQVHHTYVHEGCVRLTGRPGAWVFALPDGRIIGDVGGPDAIEVEEVVRLAARAAAEQPDRLFPAGGGEGFRLRECVQLLFDIELPEAA